MNHHDLPVGEQTMATDHIFVYGSLRREFASPARAVLDDHAEYIGEATFQGKLFMIDWYPGVMESNNPDDVVHGEVYKISDKAKVFTKLDTYEGCSPKDPKPHEFVRKERTVKYSDGNEISAWVYIYVLPVSGKERILSGNYVKYSSG